MKVLYLHPPNFAAINRAFNVRGKRVIFAFGDRIYNPARIKIPPELMVHEAVHGERQGSDPAGWWERYIADPAFRLAEEIPAHKGEYLYLCGRKRGDRTLHHIAERLASPLYGSLVTVEEALRILNPARFECPENSAPPAT